MKLIHLIFISLLFLSGCIQQKTPITRTELIFNAPVTISIYDSKDTDILNNAFDICKDFENMLSPNIETSEIWQLNNSNSKFLVSPNVLELIELSINYSDITNGLFDITTNNLSSLWDLTAENPSIPLFSDIQDSLSSTGFENIKIHDSTILLENNITIDLGSLDKGFVADEVREYLISAGISKAIVDIGGTIMTIGTKYDNSPWLIGVKQPFSAQNDTLLFIEINDLSVSTSSSYERSFEIDDIIYHHIIDPTTGYPVDSDLLSATVICKSSLIADILSTSCFVLGYEKSMELIESLPNIDAIFIDENFDVLTTSGIGNDIIVNYLD